MFTHLNRDVCAKNRLWQNSKLRCARLAASAKGSNQALVTAGLGYLSPGDLGTCEGKSRISLGSWRSCATPVALPLMLVVTGGIEQAALWVKG